MGFQSRDPAELRKKILNINEGPPKPRCLATLPNNIEEIIKHFKMQEKYIETNRDKNLE